MVAVDGENNYRAIIENRYSFLPILLKSILIGVLVGGVVTAYRFCYSNAEHLSFALYALLRQNMGWLPIVLAGLALAGLGVGFLISRYNLISGSGIPQVKGVIMGYFSGGWLGTLLAKFIGGLICILGGLSLGREGPSIQLGACVAQGVGDRLSSTVTERKILIASGASAGLAAAFNAPLAGALFALEEIFKYFSPVILLSTILSAIVADFVSRIILGVGTLFQFELVGTIPLKDYWLLAVLGGILGVCGTLYNLVLLKTQALYKKAHWLKEKVRPVVPFCLAGVLGMFLPVVLGGGHSLLDSITLSAGIAYLLMLLIAKFAFSMISFGSGAPGGIFFPLLVMGATIGAIFGGVAVRAGGVEEALFYNFIILAMGGFFSAIVKAPITGIILIVEMTGSMTHLLSLSIVSITAYVTSNLLKSEPIYDSLLGNRIAEQRAKAGDSDRGKKVTVELVVHFGSPAEGKLVRELDLPKNCLLIAVRRAGEELIPNGSTRILAGDYLVFLTDLDAEAKTRERLAAISSS